MKTLSLYVALTKPGIIIGNLITCAAGFFVASAGVINLSTFVFVLLGTGLIIAASCVVNNYLDRGIDQKMERTKKRPSVTGKVDVVKAGVFAGVLGITGLFVLTFLVNPLTALVGCVGAFFYIVMYSIWKRRSVSSTMMGSISGAIPPLAGYTAVTNRIDAGGIILFFVLVFWQMPHFYAIGIYRLKEYKAAGLPILPVKKGIKETKIHMLIFVVLFFLTSLLLTVFGYEGIFYFLVALISGLYWISLAIDGFKTKENTVWAKTMFKNSLIILTALCFIMSIDSVK